MLNQDETLNVTIDMAGGHCADDGWLVEWVRVIPYECPAQKWLDDGRVPSCPSGWTLQKYEYFKVYLEKMPKLDVPH